MILVRHIWVIREGHTQEEAMELSKEMPPTAGEGPRVLGSVPPLSPAYSRLIWEWQLQDLAALKKAFDDWGASPAATAFMQRWYAVCEINSYRTEIWGILR